MHEIQSARGGNKVVRGSLNLQDGEKIDYEKLRKAGAGILGGKYEYSRLYNNEEEGRNGAGRVAVEAT